AAPTAESPVGEPERAGAVGRVSVRVQRLEALRLSRVGRDSDDVVDREDFRRDAAVRIGNERVLVPPLRQQQRLGNLWKAIYDWRAADANRRFVDARFEHLTPLTALEGADRHDDLDRASE